MDKYDRFNHTRNKQKSLLCLKGLLSGLCGDEKLCEIEISFLQAWLLNQPHIGEDGDVVDLNSEIKDVLADGVVTKKELYDLLQIVTDILDYRSMWPEGNDTKVNELLGLLSGVTADDNLCKTEITAVKQWLENNEQHLDFWPFREVVERINDAELDGIVTDEEREELLSFFKGLAGHDFVNTGLAVGMSLEYFTSAPNFDSLHGLNCVLTGTFLLGKRADIEQKVSEHGGIIHPRITKNIDLLVVGSIATNNWIFSSYGRKIELALRYQHEGSEIRLITEHDFKKFIQ